MNKLLEMMGLGGIDLELIQQRAKEHDELTEEIAKCLLEVIRIVEEMNKQVEILVLQTEEIDQKVNKYVCGKCKKE